MSIKSIEVTTPQGNTRYINPMRVVSFAEFQESNGHLSTEIAIDDGDGGVLLKVQEHVQEIRTKFDNSMR